MLSKEEVRVITDTVHRLELVPMLFFAVLLLREAWPFRPANWKDYRRWVVALRGGYLRIHVRLWWLLGGFTISWWADEFTHWLPQITVSNLYPVIQSVFFAFGLISRRTGMLVLYLIFMAAAVSIRWPSPIDNDVLLKTVAWLAMAWAGWCAWYLDDLIRWSAVLTFGVGWACWMVYLAVRTYYGVRMHDGRFVFTGGEFAQWAPYAAYHTAWMSGAILFCLGSASTPRIGIRKQRPQLVRDRVYLGL